MGDLNERHILWERCSTAYGQFLAARLHTHRVILVQLEGWTLHPSMRIAVRAR